MSEQPKAETPAPRWRPSVRAAQEIARLEADLAAAQVRIAELDEVLLKDRGKTNEINILVKENRSLRTALEEIAEPKLRRIEHGGGPSTICLRCGVETYHEKDGEVVHEPDCASLIAAAALNPADAASRPGPGTA